MAYYLAEEQDLSSIANAIREKINNEEELSFPNDFIENIDSIKVDKTKYPYIEFINYPEEPLFSSIKLYNFPIIPAGFSYDRVLKTVDASFSPEATAIENNCFAGCQLLTNISMPDSIQHIGDQAFASCSNANIPALYLPNLKTIGNYSFVECANLITIRFPEILESIGNQAFVMCTRLAKVIFTNKPASIGNAIFGGCDQLQHIYVPWSEGEVPGIPWGATNAIIHYNDTGG